MTATVYFSPIKNSEASALSFQAKTLLEKITKDQKIDWPPKLPLKIHPGAIGNTAYLHPELYTDLITYLKSKKIQPYFIETCMASETSAGKEKEFIKHGFNQIPHLIADGPHGDDHVAVPIANGRHFESCYIARQLADQNRILVISHFKGHIMAGFGGALKMLGIGFASGQGKAHIHSLKTIFSQWIKINWDKAHHSSRVDEYGQHDWDPHVVSLGATFRERFAEYALAAAHDKKHVYLTFAINLAPNCDCDGRKMKYVYPDLGLFASTDPVAIDKAVFDLLAQREGKVPFAGSDIFAYSEQLGLGLTSYKLVQV